VRFIVAVHESAKRTSACALHMSAFDPKRTCRRSGEATVCD
jgi:hypothetical protein